MDNNFTINDRESKIAGDFVYKLDKLRHVMNPEISQLSIDLSDLARALKTEYGPGKEMARGVRFPREPKFVLQRKFLDEQDLLIIFNTPACVFAGRCTFCNLPSDSLPRKGTIFTPDDIRTQFTQVAIEMRHTWHTLDRLTISNDGSVLDQTTFPRMALHGIAEFINVYKNIRTFVLETRLEFIDPDFIDEMQKTAPMTKVNILTGFETQDEAIRIIQLGKEPTEKFLQGLDLVVKAGCYDFTSYILYKPGYDMSDEEAFIEAQRSIEFLIDECAKRNLDLTIRLNPLYKTQGKQWAIKADEYRWQPPKLSDILRLATKMRQKGIKIYIGLSDEELADIKDTYMGREDYTQQLLKEAILFNTYPSYLP